MVLGEERIYESHHLAIDEGSDYRAAVFLRCRYDLVGDARRSPNVRLDALALAIFFGAFQQPYFHFRHSPLRPRFDKMMRTFARPLSLMSYRNESNKAAGSIIYNAQSGVPSRV